MNDTTPFAIEIDDDKTLERHHSIFLDAENRRIYVMDLHEMDIPDRIDNGLDRGLHLPACRGKELRAWVEANLALFEALAAGFKGKRWHGDRFRGEWAEDSDVHAIALYKALHSADLTPRSLLREGEEKTAAPDVADTLLFLGDLDGAKWAVSDIKLPDRVPRHVEWPDPGERSVGDVFKPRDAEAAARDGEAMRRRREEKLQEQREKRNEAARKRRAAAKAEKDGEK